MTASGPGRSFAPRHLLSRPRVAGVLVVVVLALTAVVVSVGREAGSQRRGAPSQGALSLLPQTSSAGSDGPTLVAQARFPRVGQGQRVSLEQRQEGRWEVVGGARPARDGTASIPFVGSSGTTAGPVRAVLVTSAGSRVARTATTPVTEWSQVFSDDFDGSRLDPRRWSVRQPGTYNEAGSRTCSKSVPSVVDVSRGTLRLGAKLDPERLNDVCRSAEGRFRYYLNGHVGTDETFRFRYGYAEARIRFPRDRGQHGAFWLQRGGDNPQIPGDPAASGAEIDVVEYFGEGYPRGGLAAFVHFLNDAEEGERVGGLQPQASRSLRPGDAWWRTFHDFSLEWTPERYVFRVDGREFFRTSRGVSGVEQFLVLSLLTSDWELPDLDADSLPSTMQVDSVRVWQQRPEES